MVRDMGALVPAYLGEEPYLFVSYARADSERVLREIRRLVERGYRVWYDEGITACHEWPEELARALAGACGCVAFISAASVASVNVRNELHFALNRGKPLLAIHLEATELPPGLELRMGDLQALLRYRLPEDRYLEHLWRALPPEAQAGARPSEGVRPGASSVPRAGIGGGPVGVGSLLAGRYQLDRLLGRGALGTVYAGLQVASRASVAVKVYNPMLFDATTLGLETVATRARAAAGLQHPNVLRVHEVDRHGETDFLAMDLVDAVSSATLLRSVGKLDLRASLRLVHGALCGLDALHGRGVVHGDLRPANLLVTRRESRPMLSDMGVAFDVATLRRLVPDPAAGPAFFMAPERIEGEEPSAAADLFAVGATLHHLLAGAPPWTAENLYALWRKVTGEPRPALCDLGVEVPATLQDFLDGCLAKQPADRHPSARLAARLLEEVIEAEGMPPPGEGLLRNRLGVVCADAGLGAVVAAAAEATQVLSVVIVTARVIDPALRAALPDLDALLLDPGSGPTAEIETFIGRVRERYPSLVFFLMANGTRLAGTLRQFSPEWAARLGHYFVLDLDRPFGEVPAALEEVTRLTVFDQLHGLSRARGR